MFLSLPSILFLWSVPSPSSVAVPCSTRLAPYFNSLLLQRGTKIAPIGCGYFMPSIYLIKCRFKSSLSYLCLGYTLHVFIEMLVSIWLVSALYKFDEMPI